MEVFKKRDAPAYPSIPLFGWFPPRPSDRLAGERLMSSELQQLGKSTADVDDSAPRILERLVHQAESVGASDIHLHLQGDVAKVAFRLDGLLTPTTELPRHLAERVFGRIKYLARLKTYQESLPQDGRIDKAALGAQSDIRVATYPTVTGEKAVLRLFNTRAVRSLNELGFPSEARSQLEVFLRQTAGMLLLAGPAGSGKTTTIYACLQRLAKPGGRHIITIEDPAEQIVPGIMQTEVNEARGLGFARAARHLLRQDPQVLVIGEIRDEETADIAVRAALTGHLIISTLHAGSCRGVFERLFTLCTDRSAVSSCIELVWNQRLMRKLCAACRGGGCERCLNTGYHGRVPVLEWLAVDDNIRTLVRQGEFARITPRRALEESARVLVQEGVSDEAEFKRVLGL